MSSMSKQGQEQDQYKVQERRNQDQRERFKSLHVFLLESSGRCFGSRIKEIAVVSSRLGTSAGIGSSRECQSALSAQGAKRDE